MNLLLAARIGFAPAGDRLGAYSAAVSTLRGTAERIAGSSSSAAQGELEERLRRS